MAEEEKGISFRSVQLLKAQTLGIGSYGAVCKAKCDDLLCAAKIIHPTLVDFTARALVAEGKEHRLPISRFEQECQFLGIIKHPNIVQYLGTHRDPENGLPVLLMELMDESLTLFLERSHRSLPYHMQITISHDIALALSFLHLNGIIHRDLSSNNVLMIGSSRAKVTDFGMAKLADANLHAAAGSLTQTPGADVYMPPEATQIPPVYTAKIDCFSHGVLGVQIMTRQFPKPSDRLKTVQISDPKFPTGSVRVAVPEIERRQEHIDLIDPTHPLLVVALDCLQDEEGRRPTAQEICGTLVALKETPQFTQSTQITLQQSAAHEGTVRGLQQEILQLQEVIEDKNRTLAESRVTNTDDQEITETITEYQQEYQQPSHKMQTILQQKDRLLKTKDNELQLLRQEIAEKERVITEFQETKPNSQQEQQLKLQPEASSSRVNVPASIELKWRDGRKAMYAIYRGPDAVVQGSVVYFRPGTKTQFCGYDSATDQWFRLPHCPNFHSTLAVVNNILTAIGGWNGHERSNTLFSLVVDGEHKTWVKMFPPMPTKRNRSCAVSTDATLIVIGGEQVTGALSTVEVMDISTQRWVTAASLPEPLFTPSATICDGRIYVLGAVDNSSKSVFTCSLSALLRSSHQAPVIRSLRAALFTSVWSKVAELPVINSTCVSFKSKLLAIGGRDSDNNPTSAVRMYDPASNSWNIISHLSTPRRSCFVAVLPENKLIAFGGRTDRDKIIDSVEIATLS